MPSVGKDVVKDVSQDCDAIAEETPAPAPPPTDCTIVVAGLADDVKLSKAAAVGEEICAGATEGSYALSVLPMLEPDWEVYLAEKNVSVGGKCSGHAKSPLVLIEWEGAFHYVGGDRELEALAAEELGRAPAPPDTKALDASTRARYLEMLNATGHQFAFLDVQFNANTQNNKPRKVVLELYNQLCPKTCFNFRALTTGELGKREAERHGEGSWHASGAARGLLQLLGWRPAETAAVSAPRGLAHNLVCLIYSIKHHGPFCHLLAIVVKMWLSRPF